MKTGDGKELEGASITATHTPSGSVYTTVSKKSGSFALPGLRVGGPYSVKIEYVGLKTESFQDIYLALGEPYAINSVLADANKTLSEVVVTATGRRSGVDKNNATTVINQRLLTTMPTISRSISDFTRLTPQSNGNSFAGRDGRYNNVTVDGANLNNNFGLSTDPLPGGGGNPISLDAIQEVAVSIAPFDVRQGQFTGANISAVTKSGTNRLQGTIYTFYRNQSYNGRNVGDFKLPEPVKSYNKTYGGSLGGPIIKNKLFFFVNGEYEEKSAVLNYYTPAGGTGGGNLSAVPVSDMQKVSDYLKSKYSYDPGAYDNFNPNVPVKNHKILGKIDWNISTSTKLTLKYSDYVNTQTFLPSQSGGINGANSTNIITYGQRFSSTAMAFGNTAYTQKDIVRSGSLDLTSNFRGKFANQFLATITKIKTDKQHLGAQFPFVDIANLPTAKNNYISFGNEPFNGNYNVVINDVYTITDNFTYYAGKHTLTAGLSYEFQKVGNGFMPGNQGYYAYGSVDDFLNNRAPKMFALTYSLIPGQDGVISANLKVGQASAYLQDEINISDNFKLIAGLRLDKPVYPEQPLANTAVNNLSLYGNDGSITQYNTGAWPKSTVYWSPRVGFRAKIPDENMVIRGGSGLFTGRIPFVYLTNLPTGVGPYQFGTLISNPADLNNFLFNPDPHAYNPFYNTTLNPTQFPTKGGTAVPTGAYALISNNFKFPQIWRTNLGVEKQLNKGWSYSLEAIFSKDINAVYMFNANQKAPDATVQVAPGIARPSYSASAARKLNTTSGNAVVLDNTKKGSSLSVTAQVSKALTKGLSGFLAYTFTSAMDVTANPGSQANSVWAANPTSRTQNDLELSNSSFAVPHRVVGALSYRFEYAKNFATTISAYYEGAAQGTMSYIYNGDVNNDGNSADLMYIPTDASQVNFVPIAASGNIPAFTAKEQSDAFFKFLEQDKYLSNRKGQVATRNGVIQPWFNRIDLKLVQDIFTNIGSRKHTLQISVDLLNAANFFNKNWGVRSLAITNTPLRYVNATGGVANYQLATYLPQGATKQVLLDKTYINNNSIFSTWGMQLGVRYIF
ncbi:TonB-dependent receptor [Sediminibacterium sp. WSJ-3]|nr:TonB-dependent receptor [Sediminibacterium soli]